MVNLSRSITNQSDFDLCGQNGEATRKFHILHNIEDNDQTFDLAEETSSQ